MSPESSLPGLCKAGHILGWLSPAWQTKQSNGKVSKLLVSAHSLRKGEQSLRAGAGLTGGKLRCWGYRRNQKKESW